MSEHFTASNHHEWDAAGLQDYSDFSDKITHCNQVECGDVNQGEWYYIPDEPLTKGPHIGCRVIYSGSFGNYNSPGASSYTYANIYECDDDDEMSFLDEQQGWEASPEYDEEEDEEEADPDNDEFKCEGCKKIFDNDDSICISKLYYCPECADDVLDDLDDSNHPLNPK